MTLGRPTLAWSRPASPRGWASLGELPRRLGAPLTAILRSLHRQGLADAMGRPTAKALREEQARWMERARQYHWRMEDVASVLEPGGPGTREARNTSEARDGHGPMRLVAQRLGTSAVGVGQQLKRLGYRDGLGLPTDAALARGLAKLDVSPLGRVLVRWHTTRCAALLAEDFAGKATRKEEKSRANLQENQPA